MMLRLLSGGLAYRTMTTCSTSIVALRPFCLLISIGWVRYGVRIIPLKAGARSLICRMLGSRSMLLLVLSTTQDDYHKPVVRLHRPGRGCVLKSVVVGGMF